MTVAMTSDGARATALWEQALAFGDGGRPAAAVRVCERALRRGLERSPGIHAQMLITLACFKSELGDVSAALGHLDHATVVDPDCRTAALTARGFVLLRGANPDALSALDEAIAALVIAAPKGQQRGAGPSDLAAALLNRGLIDMSLRAAGGCPHGHTGGGGSSGRRRSTRRRADGAAQPGIYPLPVR